MNYCLIGGSGFIGSRLAMRLNQSGENIEIFDKNPSHFFRDLVKIGNVQNLQDLQSSISSNSIIINLAAEHHDDVQPLSLYNEVNITGAINICSVANKKNINKIIFTSTVAVYGFAPIGTDESGELNPFNEYGRSKCEAEKIFKAWQSEAPNDRTLVIIRPTVVFGEGNRGNLYNLFRQISIGRFVMIGDGKNHKSLAYVENIAAFIQYAANFKPGIHIYNYIDKPDLTINSLVGKINNVLDKKSIINFRLPFFIGLMIGKIFDCFSVITGIKFAISAIRVKKFCSNSLYNTSVEDTGFIAPVSLEQALVKTIKYEFVDSNRNQNIFYSE